MSLWLDERGLLPAGIHQATLEDIPHHFCTNQHRWILWDGVLSGLDRLCERILAYPSPYPTLTLAGSFFSDAALPLAIEAALRYPAGTCADIGWSWAEQFAEIHAILKREHHLHFYLSLPGNQDFGALLQYIAPQIAADKGLGERDQRGIIEVRHW